MMSYHVDDASRHFPVDAQYESDPDEGTALMFAAERGAIRSIQSWISRGGNVNSLTISYGDGLYTPLQLACFTGHATAVRTLLAAGADMHLTASTLLGGLFGTTGRYMHSRPAPNNAVSHKSIHLAARYGHVAALEALLEAGCDVDLSDEFGQTPLHYSAAYGHQGCISVLTRFGANVFALDREARRPEQIATAAGHMEAASFLRRLSETTAGPMSNVHTGRVSTDDKGEHGPGPVKLLVADDIQHGRKESQSNMQFSDTRFGGNETMDGRLAASNIGMDTLRRNDDTNALDSTLRSLKNTTSLLTEGDIQSIPLTPPPLEPSRARLRAWLMSIGLSEYYPAMLRHGYDDIDFIASTGGLTNSDCAAIGVYAVGHRRKLCTNFGIKPFTAQGIHEAWYSTQLEKLALKKQAEKLAQLESLLSKKLESKDTDADEAGGSEEDTDEGTDEDSEGSDDYSDEESDDESEYDTDDEDESEYGDEESTDEESDEEW